MAEEYTTKEVETLAQALSFEYYLGAVSHALDDEYIEIAKEEAIAFYEENKSTYIEKAEKIIQLVLNSYVTFH